MSRYILLLAAGAALSACSSGEPRTEYFAANADHANADQPLPATTPTESEQVSTPPPVDASPPPPAVGGQAAYPAGESVEVVSAPLPPPRVEVVPAPVRGRVWVPGYWSWGGPRGYVWVGGRHVVAPRGAVWVAPRVVVRGGRHYYYHPRWVVRGRW